jgi:hypothetical protein
MHPGAAPAGAARWGGTLLSPLPRPSPTRSWLDSISILKIDAVIVKIQLQNQKNARYSGILYTPGVPRDPTTSTHEPRPHRRGPDRSVKE